MPHVILYMSASASPLTPSSLKAMLTRFRARNARLGITGLLLYRNGHFMQLIEGDKAAVEGLYARIGLDSRHQSLVCLFSGPSRTLLFPDWSMAFDGLPDDETDLETGLSAFLSSGFDWRVLGNTQSKPMRLLAAFREGGA